MFLLFLFQDRAGASIDEQAAMRRLVPNNDAYFQRYLELADKKAYRYPDPGVHKTREGCMGGSWRHIKQVLGQGANNLVYIDGKSRPEIRVCDKN
jgi:hypothetical protein